MIVFALVLAALAALLHVYIFWMESITWTSEKTRATFGLSAQQADATREMAFNQGFYNLFLAIVTLAGVALALFGAPTAGYALVFAGAGSMLAAAAVLLVSSPDKRGAAVKQGSLPLLAVLVLLVGLVVA
ncbi:DUF1304 domain-containing protein [Leucobacter chromiiresistens]|uniref:Membrane protein n=1 Tax=Leucobacter chromiiresistens TaxID=1079994 RepID=A0A147EN00_9MICO|nr:DUF1304 domain-containing protein [Leucobacter chromiiresistens]KTR85768.1 membrane protein [Leucobacter chromiiresistens]